MKWLILLALVFVLAALFVSRYRRQIQTALYFWRMLRKVRQTDKPKKKRIERKETANQVELVRCSKCGTWMPQRNALKLRPKTFFCSADCMEKAATVR
jgi:formylmethanofuran dehydrogenase subunit E